MKIKVIEEAHEKYYAVTYQGTVLINDTEYVYRWHEDSNGAELFILEDDKWAEYDYEHPLYRLCGELSPLEFGDRYTEFEYELED